MGTDFPSVQLPSGRKRKFFKAQYKSKFENGKVISRKKFTPARASQHPNKLDKTRSK